MGSINGLNDKDRLIVYSSQPESVQAYLRRVWIYRYLIVILTSRELKIYYSQTYLGLAWAILQPVIATAIYYFFFEVVLDIDTGDIPYLLFVLPGVMGWHYFIKIVSEAGIAFQSNQDLIRKMQFPKLVLPIYKCFYSLHQLAITLVITFVIMALYAYAPTWRMLFLPFIVLLNTIAALCLSLWINVLSFKYRDIQSVIPFLAGFFIWVTPVFYPTRLVPQNIADWLYLNPMAGIIESYRWAIIGEAFPDWRYLFSYATLILLSYFGLLLFTKVEKRFVDYL